MLLLLSSGSATAAPGQDFGVRFSQVGSDNSFTVVLQSRIFDTRGGVPPAVIDQSIRLPAGSELRKQFMRAPFVCDVNKLRQTKDPATCRSAQVGTGRLLADLRPFFSQAVPSNLYVFLARPTKPEAVASLAVLAIPDPSSAAAMSSAIVRDIKPVLQGDIVKDPQGAFGYRIDLPTIVEAPVLLSISDLQLSISGLATNAKIQTCAKRKKKRCVKQRSKAGKLFWLSPPTCPPSRKLSFQNTYTFVRNVTATETATLACPRFKQ